MSVAMNLGVRHCLVEYVTHMNVVTFVTLRPRHKGFAAQILKMPPSRVARQQAGAQPDWRKGREMAGYDG